MIVSDSSLGINHSQEHFTISTLTEVSTWATLIGTTFIIVSYLAFKEIRHFHLRLVFFLAITDFFVSITFILNLHIDISSYVTCEILGASLQYFELASALWAFCIAFVLDQVIRLNNYNVERFEKYFHVICWIVPAITVVLCHFQHLFINTGLWCWVADDTRGLYRWLYFYGPLVLILCYVTTIYIIISKKIRAQLNLTASVYLNSPSETTIQQTFRWYIIGWIVCWAPAIADRVQGMIAPNNPIFFLSALHAFFAPLAGFCNSLAIGFNDEIQAQYGALFYRFGIKRSKLGLSVQDKETKIIQEILREYDVNED